jgi:hypothetical protein
LATLSRPTLYQWFSRLLFALALLLLVGHLIIYVHYAVGLMRFPFDYDQGEGFELVDTVLFSHGDWPYRNTEVYPFYASNYPPLFHIILVPFVWIFGPEYWYGRLVGFLGTLITSSAIGYAVFREGRHKAVAVMAGLAFLASNYIYHVGPLFRQHLMMVMFETLSVVVLAHVVEIQDPRRRRRVMIMGLALLLAAGYTKQMAVATAIAVFGFLFVRNPRRSIIWGVIFGAIAGAIFVWIDLATHGEWWANIIAANVNPYIPSQFTGLFKQWFRLHGVLIIMAGLFAAYELYFTRLSLYSIWWVLACAITILSGKWGAGDSYFSTAIAATCLLSGIFAAWTVRGDWVFPEKIRFWRNIPSISRYGQLIAGGIGIPLLYLWYGLTVIHMPTQGTIFGPVADAFGFESSYGTRYAFYDSAGWVEGYATIGHVPSQTDIDNGWRIVDILRESGKPAMSEEAAFSLRADLDVVSNPTQLKNLYENEMFDPTALITAIRDHDFGIVVFRAQFYPPPVVDAVYEAYYPAETIPMNGFDYQIWRPGPPQVERDELAVTLESLGPDSAVILLSLPADEAARWLTHTLWYREWEQQTVSSDDCQTWTYQKDERHLQVQLCGSEVTLNGE